MQWYYVDGERAQQGPVETEQIQKMITGGSISHETLVWNSTMGDNWAAVSDVPEFAPVSATPANATVTEKPGLQMAPKKQEATSRQASHPNILTSPVQGMDPGHQQGQHKGGFSIRCPFCGGKVTRNHSEGAMHWAGLIGLLCGFAFGPLSCAKCGTVPRREFSFGGRLRLAMGSILLVFAAIALLGLVVWLYTLLD